MSIIKYSEGKILIVDLDLNEDKMNLDLKLDICPSPICSCEEITFEFYDTESGSSALPKHRISIDISKKKACRPTHGEKETSKEDFRLAKTFVKNLSENDWDQLRKFFSDFKKTITESAPLVELDVSFPEKKIEKDRIMIGYYEIFPYAEEFWLELDDVKYLIDDQYCLASTCSCKHVALTFPAVKNQLSLDVNNSLAILFDYKKKSFKVEIVGPKGIAEPKELVEEIVRKNLDKVFKDRHKTLRILYNKFRKKKQKALKNSLRKRLVSEGTKEENKVGRNDPCPCGSGKKYKKCCLTRN